jgi:hypothetical protein
MTYSTALSTVRPIPRRGLSLVRDGRMPAPKRIDARKVWDVYQLDLAFNELPADNDLIQTNSFDDAWGRGDAS